MTTNYSGAWDPATVIPPLTLTSLNTVANLSGAGTVRGAVRSTPSFNLSGVPIYLWFNPQALAADSVIYMGVCNGAFNVETGIPGSDTNSLAVTTELGIVFFNDGSIGNVATPAQGDACVLALTSGLAWFSTDGGVTWNVGGTGGNPATLTGGYSIGGLGSGPYYAITAMQTETGAEDALLLYVPAPPPPPAPTPAVVLPPLCGWRGLTGINWNGLALVGDKFSNVVGLSDFTIFTEYGNPMQLLATAPPLHEDRKRIFVSRFEVEVEAGLGTPGLPEVAPLLVLDYSKDGGVTWVPLQVFRSMGKAGEYIKRLRWINIGNSRTWVFRIQYSGVARPSVIGTYMDFYKALG